MADTQTAIDPLTVTWYAKPSDLIGGWCVMDVDQTPALANRPEIADFTRREHAEYIAHLHNQQLARDHWHHAPDGSPYTRLKAYADGGDTPPARADVMELLRAYNASSSMCRVYKSVMGRLKRRLESLRAVPGRLREDAAAPGPNPQPRRTALREAADLIDQALIDTAPNRLATGDREDWDDDA